VLEFSPYGYDERQFCSPGFDLPVGRLSRTPNDCFPEYHTSADDLDFVQPAQLVTSLVACLKILVVLENDRRYVNQNPKCEPQLGKRGLYHTLGGLPQSPADEMAMLWVLNLSDNQHSLLEIAERSRLPFADIARIAGVLHDHGLLKESSCAGA
jgi:aminopeptidase-like protein